MNFNTGFQNRTKIGKISIWLEKRGKKSMHSRIFPTFALHFYDYGNQQQIQPSGS